VRVAEQAHQRRDPVQRRLDGMLGPPCQDLALDLAQPVVQFSRHDGRQVGAITLAVYCPGRSGLPARPAGGRADRRPSILVISACRGGQPVAHLRNHRGGSPLDEGRGRQLPLR